MMILASCCATLGGVLWAFGPLGKRIGVEGASNDFKQITATCTVFVYALTTLTFPLISFLSTDHDDIRATFGDPAWLSRIPFIMVCGAISGVGNVVGTLAFAWAAGENSALVSMIENAVYTMAGALIIAVYYGETPPPLHYLAGVLIMLGIVLAQSTSGQKKTGTQGVAEQDTGSESGGDIEGERGAQGAQGGSEGFDRLESLRSQSSSSEDGSETEESEEEDLKSIVAPRRMCKRVVILAVLGGVCWGFGPLGKKYGVSHAPENLKHAWTTATYLVYMLCTNMLPIGQLLLSDRVKRNQVFGDRDFRRLLVGVVVCGILSGLGGLVSTYAFAEAAESGAVVSVIENGVYTIFAALLIGLVFREKPTKRQGLSAVMVVAGVLVSALAK